jgi:V/A-type H+-transporting ATPase subunit A
LEKAMSAKDRAEATGTVVWVNGPVVRARSETGFRMLEVVKVGGDGLVGEVIGIDGAVATIQVYEDTSGLRPGEAVEGSGSPLSIELGPGLVSQVMDGIQRPLERLRAASGDFIHRGVSAPRLDRERRWEFEPRLEKGTVVEGGEILGVVAETPLVEHRILVPPGVAGELVSVAGPGPYTVDDIVARVAASGGEVPLTMRQHWEVRRPRPVRERLAPSVPLLTGQRIIDVFFPIAKGGTAAIPGGFGTGKTVTQNNLAKWCDADIIVYIGCGERGNEMTGVLTDFPQLKDPRSGRPLMERTILIANTSNMPVAGREASIYTGVAIAEYFRDMGYHVAVMADSTSRWAEALREISGRLEEMPAEEGFPAYLATRLAEFYERAGRVTTLSGEEGSISIIGAVSPPGGDFSEPVTQHTKRFVRCFWSLDKELASARFFPSINAMDSYSEYDRPVESWWQETTGEDFGALKERARAILREDSRLQQIVRLIGEDALPDEQKMAVLSARLLREGFLQQNAFEPVDMYALPGKQVKMLRAILRFCDMGRVLVRKGIPAGRLRDLESFQVLQRMKSTVGNEETDRIDAIVRETEVEMYRTFPIDERDFFAVSDRPQAGEPPGGRT